MKWLFVAAAAVAAVVSADATTPAISSFVVSISARPTYEDQYCVARKDPPQAAHGRRVIGFEPQPGWAVHHMTLMVCDQQQNNKPATTDDAEDACAENRQVCGTIQFVWAHGGSALYLPPGVGLHIGARTSFALQVHYGFPTGPHWTDQSGVRLILAPLSSSSSNDEEDMTTWYEPKVWLLAPRRFPPLPVDAPNAEVRDDTTVYKDMTVFAVRVHTHSRGVLNAVSVSRGGSAGVWAYSRSTQLAQSFVPLHRPVELRKKDAVRFKCVYDTRGESDGHDHHHHQHQPIEEGATKHDEMCNIYLMYYDKPACSSSSSPAVLLDAGQHPQQQRQVVGVASAKGVLVAFHRADRIWHARSFDAHEVFQEGPIAGAVIEVTNLLQPHPHPHPPQQQLLGAGQFYLPHSVQIDPYQQDVVWLTDVGSHTVSEFNLTANAVMRTVGRAMDPTDLCKPTDVALSASEVFVSDGYCHARIAVYDRASLEFKRELLGGGAELYVPHALALDRAGKVLYVADREHGRVLALDPVTGRVLGDISAWTKHPGAGDFVPYSLALLPGAHERLAIGLVKRTGAAREGKIWIIEAWQLQQLVLLQRTTTPSPKLGDNLGSMLQTAEDEDCLAAGGGKLKEPHMMAASADGSLFVAEAVDGKLEGRLLRFPVPLPPKLFVPPPRRG